MFARGKSFPFVVCASSLLLSNSRSSFSSVSSFAFRHQRRTRFSTTSMSATNTAPESLKGQTVVSVPDAIDLHSNAKNVKFIDGSWYLKGRNGRDEFQEGPIIEGATFFDIDDISTPSHLPHMMPPKQLFAAAMDAMGITNQDHIIVYGAKDCVSIRKTTKHILRHVAGYTYIYHPRSKNPKG
jgi:hypothetical protein